MITVAILINGIPIFTRSARNTLKTRAGKHVYDVDSGHTIYHKRTDGAVVLTHKMLKTITNIDKDNGQEITTTREEKYQRLFAVLDTEIEAIEQLKKARGEENKKKGE